MSTDVAGQVNAAAAKRPLALALDIGSSSVRAIVHDAHGRALHDCNVQLGYEMQTTPDGGVFVAVDDLRRLVEAALDEICARGGRVLRDVRAAGVACFSHTLVGLDSDGNPMTPVLAWADTTSAACADALRAELDEPAVWRRTGAPFHASYWPARIRFQRTSRPAIVRWSGFAEQLGLWLTGRFAASISMASSAGLLDRHADCWDEELRAVLGIEAEALPELIADDEPLGGLVGPYRQRWPELADIPWFPAWADGACGNVGLDCRGPDRAALMIGTSSAMRVLLDRRDVDPLPGLFCFRLGARGSLLGGQLSEGGGTAAWVSRLTNLTFSQLEDLAAAVEPVEHGLLLLPYLSGERGPGYHARARAALHGLSLSTGAGQLFRAALESVALGLATIDELLGAAVGAPPTVVAAGGAVARSRLWPQILADAVGRPIELPHDAAEPSSRGAALLALRYSGEIRTEIPPTAAHRVDPDARRHLLYVELLERRRRLYELARPDWEVTAPTQVGGQRGRSR